MKKNIKIKLEKYFKVKDEKFVNKILWTLKGRYEKYGTIGISRLENKNFGVSERQMNNLILLFKKHGFIINVGRKKLNNFYCNVYEVSKDLIDIFKLLTGYIDNLNEKIIKFNKSFDIVNYLLINGITLKKLRKEKITYNKKGYFSFWKKNKHVNKYNFLLNYIGIKFNINDLGLKL